MAQSKDSQPRLDVRANLRALKQRFASAPEQYEKVRDLSERAVASWLWATAPRYHLNPLFFFDPEIGVGKLVDDAPADPRGYVAYGLSKNERIVVARQYLEDLDNCYFETFYSEADDRIISYHFDHRATNECINCAQLIFAGPAPACYQQWAIRGWSSHTYVSVDEKIRSFVETVQQDDEAEQRITGELRYCDDGRIELWTKRPGERKAERTFRGMPAENPFTRR